MVFDRRAVLTMCVSTATIGCVSISVGTMDIVIENCMDKPVETHLVVSKADATVHDATYSVPEKSCSDVRHGIELEDVFPKGGEYVIVVDIRDREPVKETVSISEQAVARNSEFVHVIIRKYAVEID